MLSAEPQPKNLFGARANALDQYAATRRMKKDRIMKRFRQIAFGALLLAGATTAVAVPADQAWARSPVVYNLRGNEIGVIQRIKPDGDVIMVPTQGTLDLGYYDVVMPATMLRPRERGGWETIMSDHDIAFLPPVPYRFFMPSGE